MANPYRDSYQYRLAMIESNLDPMAVNPKTKAAGPFQFIPSTAKAYGLDDPHDVEKAMTAEEKLRADNLKYLVGKLNREPTPGELYLAHQQGASGATKLLANPNAPAVDVVGRDEVLNNGGDETMTSRQFADLWVKKFEDGYDGSTPTAGAPATNTMTVRMPDGTEIANIPAGTSKAQLVEKLKANNMWKDTWGQDVASGAKTVPTGPDNTPEAVAAADARMQNIVENGASTPNMFVGALSKFANGAPYVAGFGDEMSAAASVPMAKALQMFGVGGPEAADLTASDIYNRSLSGIRGNMKKVETEMPVTGGALELAGGVMGASGAAKALQTVTGKLLPAGVTSALANFASSNPIKAAGATAFGTGALYGFGNSEENFANRAENALLTGAISAPIGMGGAALAKFATDRGMFGLGKTAGEAAPAGAPPVGATAQAAEAAPQSALSGLLGKSPTGATLDDAKNILTPDQAGRAEALKAVGITQPTAGMVSRDPATWQFERNTAKLPGVGDQIRQRYIDSNEAIKNSLQALGKSVGGTATTPYEAGEAVVEAVTKKNREMQSEVGKLYGEIRKANVAKEGLAPNKIIGALAEASDNAYADNIISSMTRKMRRYGLFDGKGELVPDAKLSVPQAEELRKFANSLRGDKQTDHIVTGLINSLDDDVIETAGVDAFKTARDAARARFTEFESKILGGVAEGKLVADDILKKTVFGGKVKDVQALKDSLLSGSHDQTARGTQAWNDLKLQTLQSVFDTAVDNGGKIHGTGINRAIDRIGEERLKILFDADELLKLKTIQKAAEYTTIEVPESFVNHSNTASALAGILRSSKMGEFLEGAGMKLSAPAAGWLTLGTAPLAGGLLRTAGGAMKEAATRQSAKAAATPFASAIKGFTDPTIPLAAGAFGGLLGNMVAPR